ncbi:hypothetical protein [Mycobacterium tuberculosis]|nr:hypothetical protein [Mycobacterium tuberculosis]
MGSGSRERIVEVFDALDAELDRLDEVSTNTFHHPERFLHNQDDDDEPD